MATRLTDKPWCVLKRREISCLPQQERQDGYLLLQDGYGFNRIRSYFGSNATGPYLSGFGNNPDDIYEDTKARVNLSISYLPAHYTMGYLGTNDLETEALCNTFRMSTMQRIDEILQMIDKSVDFGLRTAV